MKKILAVLLLGIFTSCATSPTGRKQLKLVPDGSMNKLGISAFNEVKTKTPRETNPAVIQYVNCVAQNVLAETKDPTGVKSWEAVVFRSDQVNAFALPGGRIGIYTGILKVANTQGQLAAIMGHEVGHVIARHGNERVSQGILAQTGLTIADAFTQGSRSRNAVMGSIGVGLQFGVLLPFSRTHESEADQIGQMMMARAGFDPRESVRLWQNMARKSGGQPPEFMSTHPSPKSRIKKLNKRMPKAMNLYNQARSQGKNPNCKNPLG